MKEVATYCANIYVGLRAEYSEEIFDISDVEKICQEYVDTKGMCVTMTRTKFIYTKGNEDGVIIGLINYPRFPSDPFDIIRRANELANILLEKLKQNRISIVFPEETVMIEKEGGL